LVEGFEFGTATITLAPGDVLLLYTDGVTETTNSQKEEFGEERLAAVVAQSSNRLAQDLVHAVRDELQNHSAGQLLADDITIMALKIK
jgi:sigma-B regulation protein RsbU (phosphoserine phosphatase)